MTTINLFELDYRVERRNGTIAEIYKPFGDKQQWVVTTFIDGTKVVGQFRNGKVEKERWVRPGNRRPRHRVLHLVTG